MKYDVFISYSRKDKEIADQICDVLKKNRITYFIDTEDISGGEEFSPVLAENINSCSLFLFIGSKNSYESKWTPKELHFALNHKESIAIIPYLIDEEPLPQKIEFAIADLNVRNIKDHPIDTILIEDIKTSKEKISIRSGKEDLKMAKAIADNITSSKHDRDYCVDFLIRLGDNNFKRGRNSEYVFPNETLHYFLNALSLLENSEIAKDRASRDKRQIASVSSKIANILYSQEKYVEAASYLEKAIGIYRNSEDISFRSDYNNCLLQLCEITIMNEDYEKTEQLCTELKDVLQKRPNDWRVDKEALRMCKMLIKALKAQGKNEQADKTQDEIIASFRNLQDKESFISMLVTFADANVQEEQYVYAEKYLTEALELDKNKSEVLIKLANVLEYNSKISNAKNTYEKAFHLAMDSPLKYGNDVDFLELHRQIIRFLDKNEYYEEIEKYFKLAISKFSVDIYKGEIGETYIGNIYESYADWLTKQQKYHRSSRYLKKCQNLSQKLTNKNNIDRNMFRVFTKRSINDFGLGYKDCAINNLKEALMTYKEMNDENQYKSFSTLYELWKKYNDSGFLGGSELIKNSIIESTSINIDKLSDKATYYTDLGWTLLLMGDYVHAQLPLEEALKAEQKLKRSEGAVNNAKNNLARLYIYTGKDDKAETLLNEALSAFEKISAKNKSALHNYAESLNYFGRLRMKQKRYAEAENYFESSLENYKKAAKLDKRREEDAKETSLLLEQVKSLQED